MGIIGHHLQGWQHQPGSNLFYLYYLLDLPVLILSILSQPVFPPYTIHSPYTLSSNPYGFYDHVSTEDSLLSLDIVLLVPGMYFHFPARLLHACVRYEMPLHTSNLRLFLSQGTMLSSTQLPRLQTWA